MGEDAERGLGIESPGERHPAGRTRMGSEARSGLEDRGRMSLVVPYATPSPLLVPSPLSFQEDRRGSIKSSFSRGPEEHQGQSAYRLLISYQIRTLFGKGGQRLRRPSG